MNEPIKTPTDVREDPDPDPENGAQIGRAPPRRLWENSHFFFFFFEPFNPFFFYIQRVYFKFVLYMGMIIMVIDA